MKKKLLLTLAAGLVTSFTFTSVGSAATTNPTVIPDNPYSAMSWQYPANSYTISSDYGWRGSEFHKGFDIKVTDQPVTAAQSGSALSVGYIDSMGYYIVLKSTNTAPNNSNKLIARYLHLSVQKVSTGSTITRGQNIGTSGASGTGISGPHLHFDVNDAGSWNGPDLNEYNTVDPKLFWPRALWTYSTSLVPSAEEELNEAKVNNRENYYEDTLINYVGQKKFEKWLASTPVAERSLSKFKKDFKISDKLQQELHDAALKNQNVSN